MTESKNVIKIQKKRPSKNSTHLCSSINLGLPSILALSKDGGGEELVPVLSADKIRGLEEDGGAVVPGHAFPLRLRSKRTVYGLHDGGFVGFVVRAQMTRMVVRHGLFRQRPCLDLIRVQDEESRILRVLAGKTTDLDAIHDAGHLERQLLFHLCNGRCQFLALGRSRRIRFLTNVATLVCCRNLAVVK